MPGTKTTVNVKSVNDSRIRHLEELKYLIVDRRGRSDTKIILHPSPKGGMRWGGWQANKGRSPLCEIRFSHLIWKQVIEYPTKSSFIRGC